MEKIKKIMDKLKETYADVEKTTDYKVKFDLVEKYNDLISLRNRLQYEIENENIYEDDILALDYIMDFLEIFFDETITKDETMMIKREQINRLLVNHKREN